MKASELQEILPALMTRLTTDLAASLDCKWALAMSSFEDGLLPLFSYGENRDLEGCIAYVQLRTAADRERGSTRYWYEPQHMYSSPWLPVAIVSLLLDGEPCVIALGPKKYGEEFRNEDHALVAEFAAHVANVTRYDRFGLVVAGRLASELKIEPELDSAGAIENRWFPKALPPVEGLDYYGECQPVGGVGGDFFDLLPANPCSLSVSIGDVCGRGVPAAMITAGLQASLRALTPTRQKISALVSSLNHLVWDLSPTGLFTTMFFGTFDLVRQELHYVNAGHQSPLLIRSKRDRVVRLDPNGSVLGLSANGNFRQRSLALQPGDLFVALTDGLAESGDDPASFEKTVIEIVRSSSSYCSSLELARKILAAAPKTDSKTGAPDDRTVIVVRLKEWRETILEPERATVREDLRAVACAA